MKLDRDLQRRILECCAECFPNKTTEVRSFAEMPVLTANLVYLQQHGLVDAVLKRMASGDYAFAGVEATHKGMDFIQADGGLSAILDVVTIRLHDDTVKELLTQKILTADLPTADKKQYIDQLRELPAESTKHLVMKLLDMGLESGPQAMAWLKTLLNSL